MKDKRKFRIGIYYIEFETGMSYRSKNDKENGSTSLFKLYFCLLMPTNGCNELKEL